MQIIYAQEAIPNQITKSIFLAGPSLRPGQEGISWRVKALEILRIYEYDGVVFVPEARVGNFEDFNYETQIQWESKCLRMSDHILFYINRNLDSGLLGLTTNDEFGYWKESGKCVLVTEHGADKVRYQEYFAKEFKIPFFHELSNGINNIIERQTTCIRIDGERFIIQDVWKLEQFQSWYKQLKANGNWISDAKILNTYRLPNGNIFSFNLWVSIFIRSENRYKNNEFIISRTDISSCVLYYPRPNILESEIVLVSEFRTPANNSKGMVYELPGGSSMKPGVDPTTTMIEELHEECGFDPNPTKLEFESARQLNATMLTHKSHLFSYKLDVWELDKIKQNQNKVFGQIEDTERTYVHVVKVRDLIYDESIDWSNMGQILTIINKETL